jgi:NAD(P)-dependent dehydrogenase (short-subunit alcohol dehydrogenase family)
MGVTLVTGAASGIGRGIAEHLSHEGRRVVVIDIDAVGGTQVADSIGGIFARVDITDADAVIATYGRISEQYGPFDALVNSAGGLSTMDPSATLAPSDWDRVVAVNLSGTFYSCRAAVAHMPPGAAILNVASIAAVRALPRRVAYCASKAGIVSLTTVLAVEWASLGIRVNAIGPTWVRTPLMDASPGLRLDEVELASRMPMNRLAEVEDIVGAASFLLSPAAGLVTGQTLYIDAGFTAGDPRPVPWRDSTGQIV